jgi:TolB protein
MSLPHPRPGVCPLLSRASLWRLAMMVAAIYIPPTAAAQLQSEPVPKSELWKVNVDGSGLQQLAIRPGYVAGSPDWSPDGQWIAFDTQRLEEDLRSTVIAVIRADGTQLRHLGPGAMPSWSPDGSQLVFHTYGSPYGEQGGIVVMNADGSGREKILDHWGSPRWSPVGNRIASISPQGGIALLDMATGIERDILPEGFSPRIGFAISPDGRRFSFANGMTGAGIATLDEQTMQAAVRIFLPNGTCNYSSWSPDGKQIVFSWRLDEEKLHQLYLYNVDSSDPPILLPGQDTSRKNLGPDWSPDGKTIVFRSHVP